MVRKKVHNPQQLDKDEQQANSWNLENSEPLSFDIDVEVAPENINLPVEAIASSSGHGNVIPSESGLTHEAYSLVDEPNVLTIESDNSVDEIEELAVIRPILRLPRELSDSAANNKQRSKKVVMFNLCEDLSSSTDNEDYVPKAKISSANRPRRRHPQISYFEEQQVSDSSGSSDADGIEVLSERHGDGFSHFESDDYIDDDIVLDYDGYDMERKAKERKKRGEIQFYGDFEKVISESILVVKINRDDAKDALCLFSEISFVLSKNFDEMVWEKCDCGWLYVCPDIDSSALYFEWISNHKKTRRKKVSNSKKLKPDTFTHFAVSGFINDALWAGFSNNKTFHLKYKAFNEETKEINVSIYLLRSALKTMEHPSEVVTTTKGLADSISLLYNIELPTYSTIKKLKHDFDILFRFVKKHHRGKVYLDESVQHSALIPILRPYQLQAVQWMLFKENVRTQVPEDCKPKLHCLYVDLVAADGTKLYYNKYGGYFSKTEPLEILPTPGGILADEMGLGKTVEVLACILNNPSPPIRRPDYLEPVCVSTPNSRKKCRKVINDDDVVMIGISDDNDDESSDASDFIKLKNVVKCEDDKYEKCPRNRRKRILENEDYSFENDTEDVKNVLVSKLSLDCSESDGDNKCASIKDKKITKDGCLTSELNDTDSLCRPQRRTKKKGFSYSEMDDLCIDYSDSSESEIIRKPKKRSNSGRHSSDAARNVLCSRPRRKNRKRVIVSSDSESSKDFSKNSDTSCTEDDATNENDKGIIKNMSNFSSDEEVMPKPKRRKFSIQSSSELSDDETDVCNSSRRSSRRNSTDSSNSKISALTCTSLKSPKMSKVDMEIASCPKWTTIEKVIVDKCWDSELSRYKKEGSYKEFKDYLRKVKKDPTYMMTMREHLQFHYNQATTIYSTAGAAAQDYHKNFRQTFFKAKVEQSTYFECICGEHENERSEKSGTVQCTRCGLHQHAACVAYDVSNPYRGTYICPHCWTQEEPVPSVATIIVAPASIAYQWVDEIKKHVRRRALRVLVYRGVAYQGYVQPRTLAGFDLVVTSYETLSRELTYVDLPHSNSQLGRRFRHPKRFMAVPTPLLSVQWWRCVLDEAQLVESKTARTALMALRLHANLRWCVTGTPIQRSLDDLQGLLLFLGVDPWGVDTWWSKVLYEGYCHGDTSLLHRVIADVMWRNSKRDVIHQIDLPPQTETIHWVQFSGVEDHFYRQLHTECSRDARTRLGKYPDELKLSDIDRKTLAHLLQPLLRLRQACNHPQVVKGVFTRVSSDKPLSMVEVMQRLVERTKTQAEDIHRLLVNTWNGLAAVRIIQGLRAEACSIYREVLASAAEHAEYFRTDSLQRLHALHNLHELLQSDPKDLGRTVADDEIPNRIAEIREMYLQQYIVKVGDSRKECDANSSSIIELEDSDDSVSNWWLTALLAFDDDFVLEIREELLSRYNRFEENKCLLHQVYSKPQLRNVLQIRCKLLQKQRNRMIEGVQKLAEVEPKKLLNAAIDCHLRPAERNPPQCRICAVHVLFEEYEKNLFCMTDQKHSRTTDVSMLTADIKEKAQVKEVLTRGNWGLSEVERVLKFMQTRSLSKVSAEIYEKAQTHIKVLETMKKEFKNYRIYWRCIFDLVSGLDEVNMATLRLRLRCPHEAPLRKTTNINKRNTGDELLSEMFEIPTYIIEEDEVAPRLLKYENEKVVHQHDLRKKLGQLIYLQNLQKKDMQDIGGKNPEPCPICQNSLGEEWAVLLCGHFFCRPCIDLITKNAMVGVQLHGGSVKCPMCRQPTLVRDLSYVDIRMRNAMELEEAQEKEDVKVVGSLSSKTEEVVRAMLRIKAEDPTAKVLVFSSWNEVLEVIADGLAQNGILYRMLNRGKKFQLHLSSFRQRSEITALLLPITSGANGLNLTEAHHVFLVDPLLNPAAELQAVGRVHRMGQSKPTVVHRFLVRGTIEHRMYRILGSLHHYPGPKTLQNDVKARNAEEIDLAADATAISREVVKVATDTSVTCPDDVTFAEETEETVDDEDSSSALTTCSEELSLTIGDLKQLFACLEEPVPVDAGSNETGVQQRENNSNVTNANESEVSTDLNIQLQISVELNSVSQTAAEPNSEPQDSTEPNSESQSSAESNSEPQTSTESNSEPQTSTESNSEPQASTESNSEPQFSTETNSEPQASTESISEPQASTESISEPQASTESISEPQASTESNSEPQASTESISELEDSAQSNFVSLVSSDVSISESQTLFVSHYDTRVASASYSDAQVTAESSSELRITMNRSDLSGSTTEVDIRSNCKFSSAIHYSEGSRCESSSTTQVSVDSNTESEGQDADDSIAVSDCESTTVRDSTDSGFDSNSDLRIAMQGDMALSSAIRDNCGPDSDRNVTSSVTRVASDSVVVHPRL